MVNYKPCCDINFLNMNYKSFLRSQNLRFKILSFLKFVPDKIMLGLQYYIKLNRKINWRNPQRFTEWIQCYKVKYRNPLMHKCVDKYDVRSYVESKGLKDILVPTYGVYTFKDIINFDSLPQRFVIKTTDGSGGQNIIICKDKDNLDIQSTIVKLNSWKDKKDVDAGREWAYTGIEESRIIIEKYLENNDNPAAGIPDFKVLCFGGKPRYIIYDCDRFIKHKRNIYDTNWNRIYVDSDCSQKNIEIPKPKNFDELLNVASILSEDFPFVRVDLYDIEGKIYFGEHTFYPWSGYVQFNPDSFDFELGKLCPPLADK